MALDIVDRLIIDTLSRLNESFFEDSVSLNSLNELSREQIFEGIVLLLWNCDPKTRSVLTSTKMPRNMATRFRAAMNIVDAIKAIGVRDEITYQTLLYGQVREMRNVLIGLIEKLPNTTPLVADEESHTVRLIREAISKIDSDPSPSETTKYFFSGKEKWKPPCGACRQLPFNGRRGNLGEALKSGVEWQRNTICAFLEASALDVLDFTQTSSLSLQKSVKENLKENAPEPVRCFQKQAQSSERYAKLSRLKEDESVNNDRLMKLFVSPEALVAVTNYVDESEKRAQALQSQWIQVKAEKDKELQEARRLYDSKFKSVCCSSRLAEVSEAVERLKTQMPRKQAKLKKLEAKLDGMEKTPLNRNLYTKRIFEMVASIKKQREEVEKILVDNAGIQKEVGSLNGKLDRTFTAVEDRLYEEAQRDTSMQKAYRLLVKIHEECAAVIAIIESTGKAEREINEINDLISAMQQKGLDEMLEKVLNDWMAVKEENNKLKNSLSGLS
ncbi:unnamed protein product [Enterobius vermicularis]|uniref:Coiled-coil domain-containing protein 22 homolog n=1 Tax=Enterobius vermicularis TaxID=51028 RepID=A0A0N4UV41_ENTVE|nr:unnamed protein product [Enterobius vermicularis]